MHKCGMWEPETNNRKLPPGVPQWKKIRKKHKIQWVIKNITGKSCEVVKIMRFLKEIKIFEEI